MALELKGICEKCGRTLITSGVAYICSLRMHILRDLRRASEFCLPKLRRRACAAAASRRSRLIRLAADA